jgi:SAM-dependent methyltransferase
MVRRTFEAVKSNHEKTGHGFIRAHWQRYIHRAMRLPRLEPGAACLEIGASIMSNLLQREFGARVCAVYHELETEWPGRFAPLGITALPCEMMRDPLPVPNAAFDLILFDQVLEHFPLDPEFVVRQVIAKLAPGGRLLFSVPNFATSEKRIALLKGENPQDRMDPLFIYYAHHREPVMRECIDLMNRCGGTVHDSEWSDCDVAPGWFAEGCEAIRHLKHGKCHRVVHFLIPATRAYLFLVVGRGTETPADAGAMVPPLATSGEFAHRARDVEGVMP